MKKPFIWISIGGIVLGLIGAGGYLYFMPKASVSSPIQDGALAPEPTKAIASKLWDDPAGFTVLIPEDLRIDPHPEDTDNYAHVELTSADRPGRIILWVKDLTRGVTDTASWAKKTATGSAITFDTAFGGESGKKILFSVPEKSVYTGAVYDGVVWYAEMTPADDQYWLHSLDGILTSFTFKPLPTAASAVQGGGGDTLFDEEEILE